MTQIGAKTVTAPATVSGEDACRLGHWETGKAACFRPNRKSGDLPRPTEGFALTLNFEHTEGVTLMTTDRISASLSISQRVAAGLSALAFGALLLFGVGLAQADQLHNAAHDTRHSIGFPCH